MLPAPARGHYVEVGEHCEFFALAENYFARVVVVIFCFEPERLGKLQKIIQTVRGALAEGRALGCGSLRRIVFYRLRNMGYNFINIVHFAPFKKYL